MKRAALFAALLCVMSVAGAVPDLGARAAFADACKLSRYSCIGIRRPWVRESIFVHKANAYGLYFGGRTVWLAPGLEPELRYVVMVHEMVHYLQVYEDEKGFPHRAPFETCMREEEAYEVSDKIARRLGRNDLPRLDLLRKHCA